MANEQVLAEIQKMNFKSVAWVYLKKNGDYEKQISETREQLTWVPSKGAAAIAKKTKFGDGVDRSRVIMVSLDNKLVGLYDVVSPILASEKVKLKIYLDLNDQACRLPKGNPAGSCLTKEEVLHLFEAQAPAAQQ